MKHSKLTVPLIAMAVVMLLALACDGLGGAAPTPTAEPSIMPTATQTATPAPTNTPAAPSDISSVVLTLDDLPPGFEAVSLEEWGLTRDALSNDELTIETIFAFMEYEHFEFLFGFTTLLPTRLDQASFDAELGDTDYLIESFVMGLGASGVTEQSAIPGLDDIGDMSAGLTVVATLEGMAMRMDMVVFRKGPVGAFLLAMYLDGDTPVISIEDASLLLEAKIEEVL